MSTELTKKHKMLKIKYSYADEEAIKNYVSEAYGLTFCVFELFRDQRGAVYNACTLKNKYVFKFSHTYYMEKSIYAVNLIDFLSKQNFPTVKIIPTVKNELHISVPMPEGIRIGVLYDYIEGRTATYDDIEEIGKNSALLHNAMSSYKGIMPLLFDKRKIIDVLPEMARMTRYDEAKIIEIERISNMLWEKIKHFPSGIAHGDLFLNNIIKKDDGSIIVFDFDDAGRMPLIYDVAYACSMFDFNGTTEEKIEQIKKTVKLFLKGYYATNPDVEYKTNDILNWITLMQIEARTIGMRFAVPKYGNHTAWPQLDRLHKWLIEWEKIFC